MQKWQQGRRTQGQDNGYEAPFNSLAVLTESDEFPTRLIDLIYTSVVLYVDTAWMLISFSLHQKIYEREVVALKEIIHIEVFSHYNRNIIGFKVTMTVLYVCAFAVVCLYTCMWLPILWNRLRGMKGSHHFFNHGCLKQCSEIQFSA